MTPALPAWNTSLPLDFARRKGLQRVGRVCDGSPSAGHDAPDARSRPPLLHLRNHRGRTDGYSTDQKLLWLESEGLRYSPDLVVVLFNLNDIWFNNQSRYYLGPKPVLRLVGDSLVLTNVPVPRATASVSCGVAAARGPWRTMRRFIHQHSRLVWLAERATRRTAWLQGVGMRVGLINAPPAMVHTAGGRVTHPAEYTVLADSLTPQADTAFGGELLLFPLDGHWNEHGHRVAAQVIADLVREAMVERLRTAPRRGGNRPLPHEHPSVRQRRGGVIDFARPQQDETDAAHALLAPSLASLQLADERAQIVVQAQ